MVSLRRWLLSRQCQLTVQLSCSLLASSLFTLWSPLHFSNACLVPVFVIVVIGSLASDQHIGTRLQVCAWMLGPCWLAAILAGSLMSLAKLAAWGQPQYVAATAALAVLGLALMVFLQAVAPPGPGRVMGIIAVLIYGIMVVLSTLYHDLGSMWINAVLMLVLGMAVATVVAMLVGFLVMPSLASDEVWRLTSEALQGAGAVLSYHASLLMVDEPSAAASAAAKAGPGLSAATMAQDSKHDSSGDELPGPGKQQRQPGKHKQQQQHQLQQHQQHGLGFQHLAQHGHPTRRSSIDLAAAGAAVVAASQDAHKPAAEAAAVALSWVDTADEAVSAAHSRDFPRANGARGEQSSSGDSIASLVGSDAVADAAAEYSKRFQAAQQDAQGEGDEGQAAREPGLSEQLLQQVEAQQRQQQQGASLVGAGHLGVVDAWVCASAALAAVSARPSQEDSIDISLSSSMGLSPALPAASPSQRRSLEGAASLDFMEELDDKAFIAMMRAISQSKGSTATRPVATDTAPKPAASSTVQNAASKGGTKGLPLSKSLGALSALSVHGSTTAPEDWASAVLPHKAEVPMQQHPAAHSVAGSVLSSHASVLHPAGLHVQQQPSRFLAHQQNQQQSSLRPQQQLPGNSSKRQSLGARAWSFLTMGSIASSITAGKAPTALSNPPAGDAGKLTATALAAADAMPPLLPPPTTSAQLQPLIGRAKAALASARLEPWWLRPKSHQQLDADACMRLLDDCELLLVRLSTLEGVSEERSLTGLQLHQLAHYKGIADALALIVAQLTAFIMHVATAVAMQETSAQHLQDTSWRPHWWKGSPAGAASKKLQQEQPGKPTVAAAGAAGAVPSSRPGQRLSPFAAALAGEVGHGADADATSMGMSTLLSNMERQGSGVSSYLWEKKTGWGQAREMLKREMDACLGSYWWSVRKASKQLPVKVPRSREVMVLVFLWPICNGLLEACERVETSAQQVLKPAGTQHSTSTSSKQRTHASTAVSWPSVLTAWQRLLSSQGASKQGATAAHLTTSSQGGPVGGMRSRPGQGQGQGKATGLGCVSLASLRSRVAACWSWVWRQGQWASPLLQLVLVKPALLAVHQAVTHDVPKALSSKQSFQQLLTSRTFQSSVKLLLSTGTVLLATILLMAYIPAVAHSVPIFGYAAVVLCFQPRVEATVDQAARRVLGTILGACLGLATNSVPHIFSEPFLLLACLAAASVGLGVLARPQRRTAIVLALLTLCAVSLCGYEAACCSPRGGMSPVATFLARMASVCGACVFVALLNRLVLPWFTSDYALEQLADALEQAALLFTQIYHSQLERMRLAELVAGQLKQQGGTGTPLVPEALQVHIDAAPASPNSPCPAPAAAPAGSDPPPAAASQQEAAAGVQDSGDPAAALAACEAGEAQLLVVLRQQVLSRLVAVQLALAKESVSWKRGVLATPPLVLNVLGAMNAVKEALTSQRLALAPFTRQGAASMQEQKGGGSGMLHMMEHCYSMWALPLHPVWMQIMQTVQELTAATAAHLRRRPQGPAARAAARAQLAAKLEQLETQRLDLRHGWLELRMRLHRAVRDSQPVAGRVGAGAGDGACFWPTDSVHLFTFTYGVSRCLNAFAAAAQAVAHGLDD